MSKLSSNQIISFIIFSFLIFSCQFNQEQSQLDQEIAPVKEDSSQNQQNHEIVEFVEKLLFAAGNKNVDAMKDCLVKHKYEFQLTTLLLQTQRSLQTY